MLALTLAPAVVVNLDNLVGKSARNAVRATGAHLPPDSPDLNSSEQVFAKLKHLMRAAQTWR